MQFSDLHFNPKEYFDTSMARKQLLTLLDEKRFKCEYLFITGDIANRGDYSSAKENLEQILSRVEVSPDNVFWSVGNHDIKRGGKLRTQIIQEIRGNSDDSQRFQQAMLDGEERVILTQLGMHGTYDEENHSVRITPYSYRDKGNRTWMVDFGLHRRLGEHTILAVTRLGGKEDMHNSESVEKDELFARSKKYHEILRSERGRFTFLAFNDELFSQTKLFDPLVRNENDVSIPLIDRVNTSTENMVIIGEGGMGIKIGL